MLNFIQRLFRRQTTETTNLETEHQTTKKLSTGFYVSPCSVCGTTNISSSTLLFVTEMYFEPFTDSTGHLHYHDRNAGEISVICANGHHTTQDYNASCECGWTCFM